MSGGQRPGRIHSRHEGLWEALKSAGIVRDGDYVRRVVIDIEVEQAVKVYIERFADERLIDAGVLAAVRASMGEQEIVR